MNQSPMSRFHDLGIARFLILAVYGCADNQLPPQSVAVSSIDERWNLHERLRKDQSLIQHALLEAERLGVNCDSSIPFQVNDLNDPVLDGVAKLPGVISVTTSETVRPTSRIIHLISSEVPTKSNFHLALKQMADGGVSQKQLDCLYDEYLLQIRIMQIEHAVIVRCLVRNHGLRRIYVESITHGDCVLSQNGPEVDGHGSVLDRIEKSRVDAVGTSHWMKELQSDFPSEFEGWKIKEAQKSASESILQQFNNVARLVQKRNEQLMDAEVRSILIEDSCCLIVGDDNDFTENVNRLADGKCEYIRIQTKYWQSMLPLDPNIWGR